MHALLVAGLSGGFLCLSGPARAADQHPLGAVAESAPTYRHDLLSLHRSLVEIPSISGTENQVGSFLVEHLTERGYVAQLQFLPPSENTPDGAERFNVVAWPGPTRNPQPRVLLTSHMDVVPPYIAYNMSAGPVGPDTVISGRGSVDAKGSVAAQITAVDALLAREAVRPGDVMLLFVVGEETVGDGMRFFSDTLAQLDPPPRFGAAIFGEPTDNRLACGHKGSLTCRVRAAGTAGHSGYPWLGKSANEVLVRALVRVLDADLGSGEAFGNTTVNIGVLEGGIAGNVIPAEAHALVTIRVAAGNQSTGADMVKESIENILKDVDADAFDVNCEDDGYGPVVCNCEADGEQTRTPESLLGRWQTGAASRVQPDQRPDFPFPMRDEPELLLSSLTQVAGFDTMIANYGTDVPNLKDNATKYLYGPGSILVAHSNHEALKVSDLEKAVEGYKKLVLHALGAKHGDES